MNNPIDEKKRKEHFGTSNMVVGFTPCYFILLIIAIICYSKRNPGKINIVALIVVICCPCVYILWYFIAGGASKTI